MRCILSWINIILKPRLKLVCLSSRFIAFAGHYSLRYAELMTLTFDLLASVPLCRLPVTRAIFSFSLCLLKLFCFRLREKHETNRQTVNHVDWHGRIMSLLFQLEASIGIWRCRLDPVTYEGKATGIMLVSWVLICRGTCERQNHYISRSLDRQSDALVITATLAYA